MLWTASFRAPGLLAVEPRRLVSIARTAPRGFKGRTYPALAPSRELLDWWRGLGKEFQNVYLWPSYAGSYNRDVLRPLLPRIEEVYTELGSDAIMLCWEQYSANGLCHRFLVAHWFWQHHPAHPDVDEWTPEREAARRQVQITDAKLNLWTSSDHATSAYRPIIPRPGERRWNDGLPGPKEDQAT